MTPARAGEENAAALSPADPSGHENGTRDLTLDGTVDQSAADQERAQRLSQCSSPPAHVEGYDIERCLGAGAFGTVWLAVQKSTGKRVAIKFYEHRGGLDWSLLHREVEKLAFLYTERDIVRLIDVGWDASPPYYVMEYLERGSLEDVLRRGRVPVPGAVRIVREVAQALVHAHGRGILHCDLKPANVLLDNDWKARLADFGQSRLSHEQVPALGTLFYMAPEQADVDAVPDARWDVYALGALLFHMVTGRPPYRTPPFEARLRNAASIGERLADYRRAIRAAPRPAEHRAVAGMDRALAEIIERCLAPDPARRFPNAQAVLAAIDHRARSRARRPLITLGLVGPLLLLAATVTLGVIGWRDAVHQSEGGLVRAVQAGNVYAAKGVASTVLLELHKFGHAVEHTAQNEQLRALLRARREHDLQEFVEQTHQTYSDPHNRMAPVNQEKVFESWVVMDPSGAILARSPQSSVIGGDYSWRDYYKGAFRKATQPNGEPWYISRVFQSESDSLYKFGISMLVRDRDDPDSEALGVVMATVTTGSLPVHDDRRTAVLVGRWDTNRRPDAAPDQGPAPKNLVLFHPAYHRGDAAVEVHNGILSAVQEAGQSVALGRAEDDDYRDPLGTRFAGYAGRWLAGFAPVGNTEFVVIVEQPYEAAVGPVNSLAHMLARRGWMALSAGVVILASMWYLVQRGFGSDAGQASLAAQSGSASTASPEAAMMPDPPLSG